MPRVTTTLIAEDTVTAPEDLNSWMAWIPLFILPAAVCLFRSRLQPWEFMWSLSIATFCGCKWQTWCNAREARRRASALRNIGYLFLWPGMDADIFLNCENKPTKPTSVAWFAALAKTVAGIVLLVVVAGRVGHIHPLLTGWTAMLGLILFLHFGTFHLLALLWQSTSINAEAVMRSPLRSTSLGEFWGKRWNLAFHELMRDLVFQPVRKRLGVSAATLAAFLASGLLHDFVISFPARGCYGLPTAYFVLQGLGVLFERSRAGRWLGLREGVRGWLFALTVAGAPVFLLFHRPFVMTVIVPFVAAIRNALVQV